MPRSWTQAFCVAYLICVAAGVRAADTPRTSETLLPNTTQGFFAISNVDTLDAQWNKTQLGHLMADPVMEPFRKDIGRQFEARWSNVHERLGLTLEDMRGVPGGDVGIGLIGPAPGKSALAIVTDVTGKLAEAKAMLEKVTKAQLERGAKRSELAVEGCPDPVVQFDLPELEEEKTAAESTLRGTEKSEAAKKTQPAKPAEALPQRQAFYCLTGNLMVVTDNLDIMKGILGRAAGRGGDSLADHVPFQVVMARCKADYGQTAPQIRWFLHPLGYAEAARASTPESKRRKGKSILEIMRRQGVGAIQGVGGFVDFATESYELVHRTAVHAPLPYEKAMKMLVLPNATDFAPQSWVPRNIATYTTLYFDILNAFDNAGPLIDEFIAEGEEGVWENEMLPGFQSPEGPGVDLREELMTHLGRRISILTDCRLPITTTSERLMFAIETTDAKAVASAIEKLMKNDPLTKRREVHGQVIWEIVEDDSTMPDAPTISFGDVPAVAPANPIKRRKKDRIDDEEDEEANLLLPHAAFTVWKDHLLIASHIDFLLKVINPPEGSEPLATDAAYQTVDADIQKLLPKEKCARSFSRTDEEYRPTYELVRQNKMPEGEGMLARLLNALFGNPKKGSAIRKQKIDGSQLPDYDVVQQYLGPAGFQATSEKDGWYLKGFTLTKEEEKK